MEERNNDATKSENEHSVKQSKDFSQEEKDIIIARAKAIGISKAAKQFNTTRWVIRRWLYGDPTSSEYSEKVGLAKRRPSRTKITLTSNNSKEKVKPEKSLLKENALLKEKISDLNQQIEQFKEVIKVIA